MTVFLDTESNGCIPEELCQVAGLFIDKCGNIIGRNSYFRVERMNEHAYRVHGLSRAALEKLSGGARFFESAVELYESLGSAGRIVGHNISSDMRLLNMEFHRSGLRPLDNATFCTMRHFDLALGLTGRNGKPKQPSLTELCRHYFVSDEMVRHVCDAYFGGCTGQHDARYDCAATYLCVMEAQRRGDVKGVVEIGADI